MMLLYSVIIIMPRQIDSYRKPATVLSDSDTSSRKLSVVPLAIFVILAMFCANVGADAYSEMAAKDKALAEQSRLCLVEFNQKQCDSLKPTPHCQELLKCVQMEDGKGPTRMTRYLDAVSSEILTDFHFPTVIVALLLLFQLAHPFKHDRNEHQD